MRPSAEVIGVQASCYPSMWLSLNNREPLSVAGGATLADGIAVKRPGRFTLPLVEKFVDDIVLVSEEEIAGAILLLLERAKLLVEGAGACSLAALICGKARPRGRKVVALLSGGNIDLNILRRIMETDYTPRGRGGV